MNSQTLLLTIELLKTKMLFQVQHWNLNRYLNMALDGDWKDDLDVTRVIQAPVVTNFVTQPDIPLESFNPLAYKRPSEHREPKVA